MIENNDAKQRVKDELAQLEERIEKLSNFIKDGRPKGIKFRQYRLLKKQLKVMRSYAMILHNRLLVW